MRKIHRRLPAPKTPEGRPRIRIRRERGLRQKVSVATLRRAVHRTLDIQAVRVSCSISLILAGDETMVKLNTRYRGIPQTTDVLSFCANVLDPATGIHHLGDIAISLPRAEAQSRARRKPLDGEVALLAVHGTLHLLGFDHDTAARKKRMWRTQKEILKELEG